MYLVPITVSFILTAVLVPPRRKKSVLEQALGYRRVLSLHVHISLPSDWQSPICIWNHVSHDPTNISVRYESGREAHDVGIIRFYKHERCRSTVFSQKMDNLRLAQMTCEPSYGG